MTKTRLHFNFITVILFPSCEIALVCVSIYFSFNYIFVNGRDVSVTSNANKTLKIISNDKQSLIIDLRCKYLINFINDHYRYLQHYRCVVIYDKAAVTYKIRPYIAP